MSNVNQGQGAYFFPSKARSLGVSKNLCDSPSHHALLLFYSLTAHLCSCISLDTDTDVVSTFCDSCQFIAHYGNMVSGAVDGISRNLSWGLQKILRQNIPGNLYVRMTLRTMDADS